MPLVKEIQGDSPGEGDGHRRLGHAQSHSGAALSDTH
jgi:hypothetical protein